MTSVNDHVDIGGDLAEHFLVERREGVLRLRMHTDGGPAVYSMGLHRAWGRIWRRAAELPGAEVLILTGTSDAWTRGVDPELTATPFREWTGEAMAELHRDRLSMLEGLVFGVDVPTIGVVNGPGLHTELALFCDLTLCTPDAVFFDGHFGAGQVPGDGMFLAMQALLGDKRAAYHLYTGRPLDAAEALRLGLVNEVLPLGDVQERAWELGASLAGRSRAVRTLTHAMVQRPMRRRLLADYGPGIGGGLLGALIDKT